MVLNQDCFGCTKTHKTQLYGCMMVGRDGGLWQPIKQQTHTQVTREGNTAQRGEGTLLRGETTNLKMEETIFCKLEYQSF